MYLISEILSWHVLSRKNIQRVREDEAAAKRAEEEKSRRAALAVSMVTTVMKILFLYRVGARIQNYIYEKATKGT